MKSSIKRREIEAHKSATIDSDTMEWHLNRPRSIGPIHEFSYYKALNQINRLFGRINGKSIINICCGSGGELEYIEKHGGKGFGMDLSYEMCKIAKLRALKNDLNYIVIVGDAENLPFKDDSFEVGFCHQGLHHLPTPHMGISELCRVSRRAIGFIEPYDCLLRKVLNKFGLFATEYSGFKTHNFTEKEIVNSLYDSGFRKIKILRYFAYFPKFFRRLNKRNFVKIYSLLTSWRNPISKIVGNQVMVVAFFEEEKPMR